MLRILYATSTLKCSGPTNQLYNLIKNLDNNKFEPHLVTLSPESTDNRWDDFRVVGVRLHSLQLSRLAGLFLAKSRFKKIVSQISPDLIHTQGIRGDILSAGLSINVPRVCTVRNIPQQDYLMTYGALKARVMVRQHINAMKRISVCVCVSEAVASNLLKNFSMINLKFIKNGVDTEIYFPPLAEEKTSLRATLSLPRNGRIWISSGHLSPRKDPIFLIHAWASIYYGDSSNHLVFIGDGALHAEVQELSKNVNNIHVLGRVNNVADYLSASDYFLSSSKAEGLPNAVLEALSCGLPVLLSDIGPHKEILEMNPNVGRLYQLGNKETFARRLREIEAIDRRTMSEAARGLIFNNLSAKIMSHNYQRLYAELLGEKQ